MVEKHMERNIAKKEIHIVYCGNVTEGLTMAGGLKEDFTEEVAFEPGFWRVKRILLGKIWEVVLWIKMLGVQSHVVGDKANKADMRTYYGGVGGKGEWYSWHFFLYYVVPS